MALTHISITAVRNLCSASLSPSPGINLVYGANGSGKTSLLEAIHLLGLARSFRSPRPQAVIQHEQPSLTVHGQVKQDDERIANLGLARYRNGDLSIRIDGQNVRSAAGLAELLPLQLLNPESFKLLEGSPRVRRQFMDWGVFHVEQRFLVAWQRLQQALAQRNAGLRHAILSPEARRSWDHQFSQAADEIDLYRQRYIDALRPVFQATLAELSRLEGLTLSYYRGWDRRRDIREVLESTVERDLQMGFTHAGPQRADLRLGYMGHAAAEVLSRGQQKLVVSALRIAQGRLLNQLKRGRCVYLVDDLPSELDQGHRLVLCQLLEGLRCQVFVTSADPQAIRNDWSPHASIQVFHVEQGNIYQESRSEL